MTTQYTPILQLALPVTGELNGTWGDVVNDNITSMVEEAIAGLATINTWTANSHTLTTADGVTDEARCAMLVAATGSGGTALSAAGEIICPARTKLFVLQNNAAYQVTLKTASGSGVAVAAGETAFLFCDGTNVNACVTTIVNGHITGNLTVDGNATVNGNTTLGNATSDTITANARIASDLNPSADNTYDLGTSGNSWRNLYIDGTATIATLNVTTIDTTNLEVTNIKAKDGTASITLADSTGVATLSANPILNAGAANGVAYLNGSKVLTTGSGLVFDGSNLGLGVTPSAWTLPAFQSNYGIFTGSAEVNINANTYYNGSWRYINSTVASRYSQFAGAHAWYTAPSGTAGNAISFTQAMTLDASGNLAIGGTTTTYGSARALTVDSTGASALVFRNSGAAGGTLYNSTTEFNVAASGAVPITFSNNSTERMRIDSSGNLLVGTTTALNATVNRGNITLNGASASILNFGVAGSSSGYIFSTTTDLEIAAESTRFMRFSTNGSERMRIDSSGNVQIGATAPYNATTDRLTVSKHQNAYAQLVIDNQNSGASAGASLSLSAYGGGATFVVPSATPGTNPLLINVDGSERMRIDSSGNIGIGTSSPSAKLTIGGSGDQVINLASTNGSLGVRGGNDSSSAIVVMRGSTSSYNAAGMEFYTNNAERMRIDSAGNVGIGTSSPIAGCKLTVASSSEAVIAIQDTDQANTYLTLGHNNGLSQYVSCNGSSFGQHIWYGYDGSSFPERMRIDSSGNVGIGTGSPGYKLDVGGMVVSRIATNAGDTFLSTDGSVNIGLGITGGDGFLSSYGGATKFIVNAVERMRIDSSGNLLVGATAINETSSTGFRSTSAGQVSSTMAASTSGTNTYHVYSTGAGAYRFYVGMQGQIYCTNTTISSLSDRRYKENVRDLDVGLDAVMALKPRVFDWKEGKGKDIKNDRGFIAQEFEQVFPDLIDEWKDPAPEGEEPYKSVRQDLIPVLVKAIQEQQELINQLTARVAQLEGN